MAGVRNKNELVVNDTTDKDTKLKGRGGKGNFPCSRAGLITSDEDRALVSNLLTKTFVLYKQPRVESVDELVERFDWYFGWCAENGNIPTVEGMCLASGYSIEWMCAAENGRFKKWGEPAMHVIKNAKLFLREFDAQLVISGKMNFLAYAFRGKVYYDMDDTPTHHLHIHTENDSVNADDIAKRYGADLVDAETTTDFAQRLSGANPNDFDADN